MNPGMLLRVLASAASFVKCGEVTAAQECSDDRGCLTIANLLGHGDCSQNASPSLFPYSSGFTIYFTFATPEEHTKYIPSRGRLWKS